MQPPLDLAHPEIPGGSYCYRTTGVDLSGPGGPVLHTVVCPHFTSREVNGVKLPWCSFLGKGSVPAASGSLSEDERHRLAQAWGEESMSEDDARLAVADGFFASMEDALAARTLKTPAEFDLFLLWDSCKECGVNPAGDEYGDPHVLEGVVWAQSPSALLPRRYPAWFRFSGGRDIPMGAQVGQVLRQIRTLARRYEKATGLRVASLSLSGGEFVSIGSVADGELVRAAAEALRKFRHSRSSRGCHWPRKFRRKARGPRGAGAVQAANA